MVSARMDCKLSEYSRRVEESKTGELNSRDSLSLIGFLKSVHRVRDGWPDSIRLYKK